MADIFLAILLFFWCEDPVEKECVEAVYAGCYPFDFYDINSYAYNIHGIVRCSIPGLELGCVVMLMSGSFALPLPWYSSAGVGIHLVRRNYRISYVLMRYV